MSEPKTGRHYWSPAEHSTLKRMAADGCYAADIAEAVGRTRNAVIGRANRKGVKLQHDHHG